MIRRHTWSMLSFAVTAGAAAGIGGYIQYQYRFHHVSSLPVVHIVGLCAACSSVTIAAVAMFKERASALSLIALVVGVLSFVFYIL